MYNCRTSFTGVDVSWEDNLTERHVLREYVSQEYIFYGEAYLTGVHILLEYISYWSTYLTGFALCLI